MYGLEKFNVKATDLVQVADVSVDMLEWMPQRDTGKETKSYYYQEYKIACPNIEYSIVKEFLRSANYNGIVLFFFLKDKTLPPIWTLISLSWNLFEILPDHFQIFFAIFYDFFRFFLIF